MKYLLSSFLFCALSVYSYSQVQYLTIEGNHSTIGFVVDIAGGVTKVTGKFMDFDLEADYVEKDWTKSKFKFVIQAASINTGIEARDNHLRTSDFFDTEIYPEISFVSNKIEKLGEGTYEASGIFTMRGVSNDITLPIIVRSEEKNTIGIIIETSINRMDYGVGNENEHSTMENFLSPNIDIRIYMWTKRDKRKE